MQVPRLDASENRKGPRGRECDPRVLVHTPRRRFTACLAGLLMALPLSGCTSINDYVHNGFKVGPNYAPPPVPVAQDWIESADVRVRKTADDLSRWWTVFNDPVLDALVCDAYRQNLTLRQAGFRVLQARAQLGIAVGNIFPQTQQAAGDRIRNALSTEVANSSNIRKRFYTQWDFGFNLAWELDFWGRFRRAIESADDSLDASVENYDDVLVTLLGDVATNYVNLRTFEQRIVYARANVELQRETLKIAEARFRAGTTNELDVVQARSTLEQTQAQIPELEISLRQANNQLCVLLGIPPEELRAKLGSAPIPNAPAEVAVGIPADLLRRRPDVRRAERQAAAQSAQIGIAEADFYPHISIIGTIGYSAEQFKHLSRSTALNGSVGPSFQWDILNYGRTLNNVRLQEAGFQELVAIYQNSVLTAGQEAENGLVTFLRAQERTKYQAASVEDAEKAVTIALAQYKAGTVDFTRVTQVQQTLVLLQDTLAQARGEIALGLIQVYRALGGGWEIRYTGCETTAQPVLGAPRPADGALPAPDLKSVPPTPKPTPKKDAKAPIVAGLSRSQWSGFASTREKP
jgi:NodT family efflux transporter outer membrane factor (OMF) lipoprotein